MKQSGGDTPALITWCPMCSHLSDNKSDKATVVLPQGRLDARLGCWVAAGEIPSPVSEHSVPSETLVGVEPQCPAPVLVAVPL